MKNIAFAMFASVTTFLSFASQAPVANADSYVAVTNVALAVAVPGVLGNDSDVNGVTLTANLVQPPQNGTVTLNADGSFTYQSNPGFSGVDSFTYFASNGVADSIPNTVTLDVRSLSNGLLGYWKLDDGSGQIAVDSASTRNATISGVTTWTTGPVNGALLFNGIDTVASVPDEPALSLTGDMSIAFWMKRTQRPSTWARIIGKGNNTLRNYGIWDSPDSDKILFQQGDAAGKPALELFSNTSIQINTWVYVIATVQSGTASIYINGKLDATDTVSNTPAVSSDPLTFGYADFVNNAYFNGTLDDIRLYNRALDPVEIKALNLNTPLLALADNYVAVTNLALNVQAPGILGNDFDPSGGTMTASLVQTTVSGNLMLNNDGSFAYQPNPGFIGADSFTYNVTNGHTSSGPILVTLSVRSLSSGLLGYWKLDDGNGQIAVDSTGVHDATITGAATWTSGPVDGALNFNGTDTVATVPDDPALRLTGDMSVAFWMKRSQRPSTWARIIGKGNNSLRNYGIWDSGPNGDKILFQQADPAQNPTLELYSNTSVQFNTWVYIVTTIQSGQASIYINGKLDATGTVSNTPAVSADPLTFGYADFVNNAYFNGVLDDIRLYNRALDPVEIQALNLTTRPVTAPDTYTSTGLAINVSAPGVLANDLDIQGRPLTASISQQALHGVATLNSNGSFTYQPDAGYDGSDSFTYTASDGVLTSSPETVSVLVNHMTVVSMTPTPGSIVTSVPAITIDFNAAPNPSTVNMSTVRLVRAGPDGILGTPDDIIVNPAGISTNGNSIVVNLNGVALPNDKYQLSLGSGASAIPTNGLKAWWRMNEGSGTVVSDSSGNNVNGTLNGGVWTKGKFGNALQFGANNAIVTFNAPDIPPPWTASMWVNRTPTVFDSSFLMRGASSALKLEQYSYTHKVGFTQLAVKDYPFDYIAPDGIWTHLTYVGTATNTSLYVNGQLQDSVPVAINMPMQQIGDIGESPSGILDEMCVYDRALSPSEIVLLAQDSLADISGNALDGEFSGTFPSGDGVPGGDFVATFTIQRPQTPTITWPNPANIVFGIPLGAPQLNATANALGTFTYSPPAGTVLPAGTHTLNGLFTPSDSSAFTPVSTSVSILVQPAPLIVTADDKNKIYGAPNPAFTATCSGFVNGDTLASLSVSPVFFTAANANSDAGTYPILVSAAANQNYSISFVPGTLTVSKAPLSISADATAKIYGSPNPALTATYSGFVNADGVTSLTAPLNISTNATASSPVGAYTISVSGAASPNYLISFANGSLSVIPAPLSVKADNQSRFFGQENPALTISYSGFVNGDTTEKLSSPAIITTEATTLSPPGNYPILISGASSPNYTVTFANGNLTVRPLSLTPLVSPQITSSLNASAVQGQPFTYKIVATGTAPISFTAAGLPSGLNLDGDTISGATQAVGAAQIILSASNQAGTDSEVLLLVISPASGTLPPPAFLSLPQQKVAQSAGQPVTLAAAGLSSSMLVYTWDFGDGTTGSGASATHVYTAAGIYQAKVTITDGQNSITQIVDIPVNAAPLPGTATGTFAVLKSNVSFNFMNYNDTLSITGMIPVEVGVDVADEPLTLVVGTTKYESKLDENGKSTDKLFSLATRISKGKFEVSPAKFKVGVKAQKLFDTLKTYGFTNTNIKKPGNQITVPLLISINQITYAATLNFNYTAKAGKTGSGLMK